MNASDLISTVDVIDGADRNLRELVHMHTLDALACLAVAVETKEASALVEFYRRAGASDAVSVAAGAAAAIRFTEWDAIEVPSCATPDAMAIPVALTFSSSEDIYTRAVAAGHAVGVALSQAVGGVSALPETWPGLFAAPAIAAVSAAIALELSAEQIAQALVLSMAGSSGRNGRPSGSPSGRWFAIGEATMKGIRAALAAKAGVKGDLELFSPGWMKGQSAAASELVLAQVNPEAIKRVLPKPFVSAQQGMNAISAFREILKQGVDPNAITSVKVFLPSSAVAVVSRPLSVSERLSTIAHLGLQFGIAAFEPARLTDVDRTQVFSAKSLKFAQCVTVEADNDNSHDGWPARVAVAAQDRSYEARWSREPHENIGLIVDRKIQNVSLPLVQSFAQQKAAFSSGDRGSLRSAKRLLSRLSIRRGVEGAPEASWTVL